MIQSPFFFSLASLKPQLTTPGGNLTSVTGRDVPGFVNISFSLLQLKKGGYLEPIWHPNAQKIGYCTQGSGWVSIRSPRSADTFSIKEGEMFFIPQGYVHQITQEGANDLVVNFALNHTAPETMSLPASFYSLSDSVFTATFNAPATFYEGFKKNQTQTLIKTIPPFKTTPTSQESHYKFDIKNSQKAVLTKGGYVQLGTKTNLPILEGLGILGFGLNSPGIVEPHWHTNAGELVYIVKGQTRITVLSPDGKLHVMEVGPGQGAFAPASHFHNIENIGKEEVQVIAYFSHADPDYIGLGEVVGSYPNALLSSLFNMSPTYFDTFKKPEVPLVIVPL